MLKLIAVRHGNAVSGEDDLGRVLSEKGVAQAKARRASLENHVNVSTGLVLSSPAKRAIQTAEIVFPGRSPIVVPELYTPEDPSDKMASDLAFSQLGYATLRSYVGQDTGWLHRWGWNAVRGVRRIMDSHGMAGWPPVAIVGHAVFLNMIGALLCSEHAEKLFDLALGEAEAFMVKPDASGSHWFIKYVN